MSPRIDPAADVPSYVGGVNMPMGHEWTGRFDLSRPLARIEVHPRRVSLRPRGPLRFVLPSRSVPLSAIRMAFPLARVPFQGPALGLSCADGDYYIWSRSAGEILRRLESAGVHVDPAPRRVTLRSLTFGRRRR